MRKASVVPLEHSTLKNTRNRKALACDTGVRVTGTGAVQEAHKVTGANNNTGIGTSEVTGNGEGAGVVTTGELDTTTLDTGGACGRFNSCGVCAGMEGTTKCIGACHGYSTRGYPVASW